MATGGDWSQGLLSITRSGKHGSAQAHSVIRGTDLGKMILSLESQGYRGGKTHLLEK